MKQTAVEWLFEQISSSKYYYKIMEDINSRNTVAQSNIFEQAKAMEKDHIIQAYYQNGWNDNDNEHNAEQYYNQTYKQD
jgi:hypothetical protein